MRDEFEWVLSGDTGLALMTVTLLLAPAILALRRRWSTAAALMWAAAAAMFTTHIWAVLHIFAARNDSPRTSDIFAAPEWVLAAFLVAVSAALAAGVGTSVAARRRPLRASADSHAA